MEINCFAITRVKTILLINSHQFSLSSFVPIIFFCRIFIYKKIIKRRKSKDLTSPQPNHPTSLSSLNYRFLQKSKTIEIIFPLYLSTPQLKSVHNRNIGNNDHSRSTARTKNRSWRRFSLQNLRFDEGKIGRVSE